MDSGYSAAAGSLAGARAVLARTTAGALERTIIRIKSKNKQPRGTHGGSVGLVRTVLAGAFVLGARAGALRTA